MNGLLTLLAAVGGVLLGAKLFGGRVHDIETAIEASQAAVNDHIQNMEKTLTTLRGRAGALDDLLAGLSTQVGRIEANQAEADEDKHPDENRECGQIDQESQPATKERILEFWRLARDHMEALANNPDIDGRRRAKYWRIDRRSYDDFIDALERDGILPSSASQAAREAHTMRNTFRRRSTPPSEEELARMQRQVHAVLTVPLTD